MKIGVMIFAAFAALTGSCATQATKEYVDKRDAASVADSKGYTDIKVAELARDLPTKETLKPLVDELVKTNIYPWAREKSKPVYSYEEVGALPDTTFVPTKVSDIDNDLNFVPRSVVDGKMSMTNLSGSAYIGWIGLNTFFGFGSFSFGKNCDVGQHYSFAIGEGTRASGKQSHAVGYYTTASGDNSNSSGMHTVASGFASDASGWETEASGDYSRSEGFKSRAIGDSSHAEGGDTCAYGEAAHAEGVVTRANGSASHAEGMSTYADGEGSHAEGYKSIAEGVYSHVSGAYSLASKFASSAIGFGSVSEHRTAYVWQGTDKGSDEFISENVVVNYFSHGPGTYNINPVGGIEGFYIGDRTIKTIIEEVAPGGGGGVTEARVGEIATNVVRECSLGGIWDADLQVWWTPVMSNGKLTYQATANVNLNVEN